MLNNPRAIKTQTAGRIHAGKGNFGVFISERCLGEPSTSI
jgi:hypothetical protein